MQFVCMNCTKEVTRTFHIGSGRVVAAMVLRVNSTALLGYSILCNVFSDLEV